MYENQNTQPSDGSRGDRQAQGATPLSAMAIAGLVLGVIALVTSLLPIINNVSFVLALLGGVFAVIGLVAAVRATRRGKGLAIAALVVCIVSVVAVLASQSAYSTAIDEALSGSGSTGTAAVGEGEPTAQAGRTDAQAKFEVSIDDCTVTSDYAGSPAIVVTYTWTNNSDKDQMFDVAISDKAYQNGIELGFATISSSDATFDMTASMKEIKPGTTQTVQQAFLLDDESDVKVECAELFNLDDEVLAEKTFAVA